MGRSLTVSTLSLGVSSTRQRGSHPRFLGRPVSFGTRITDQVEGSFPDRHDHQVYTMDRVPRIVTRPPTSKHRLVQLLEHWKSSVLPWHSLVQWNIGTREGMSKDACQVPVTSRAPDPRLGTGKEVDRLVTGTRNHRCGAGGGRWASTKGPLEGLRHLQTSDQKSSIFTCRT